MAWLLRTGGESECSQGLSRRLVRLLEHTAKTAESALIRFSFLLGLSSVALLESFETIPLLVHGGALALSFGIFAFSLTAQPALRWLGIVNHEV